MAFFFADEETATEIFQNAFITLWENIERRKIYAGDGMVMGKNDEPLDGSVLTYFMGIARIKYLEWTREHPFYADAGTEMGRNVGDEKFDAQQYINMLYDTEDNKMIEIISDVVSRMSRRCYEILSKFYYEEKNLDTILLEIPSIESKNALKTKKYKCLETLRASAKNIYQNYLDL